MPAHAFGCHLSASTVWVSRRAWSTLLVVALTAGLLPVVGGGPGGAVAAARWPPACTARWPHRDHVTGAQKLGWARGSSLGAGADRWAIALSAADTGKNVAFTYEAGAAMAARAAPARRVGLGCYSATIAALTTDGWALFDNAVAYARSETGYRHDANGNLTADSASRTLAYSAADQTTAVPPPSPCPASRRRATPTAALGRPNAPPPPAIARIGK